MTEGSGERLRPSLGRPVFAATDAARLGEVKAVVVDQPPRNLVALQVGGSKRSATFVDWSAVQGFGPDAVIVSSAEAMRQGVEGRETATAQRSITLLGARIIDTDGRDRGTVTEVTFDPTTGQVLDVEGGGLRWPAATLRALGSYALVVDAPQA